MLTEELSPKMTLQVASGLFELYLTLADIQHFWSYIPGRWVPQRLCPWLPWVGSGTCDPGLCGGGSPRCPLGL